MKKEEIIIQLLSENIKHADIELEGEDCNFTIWVISESFDGQSPLTRQKNIMAILGDMIKKGELHALSIKAFTAAEWEKRQQTPTGTVQIQL